MNVLEDHVLGKRKLASTQVNAALGLLRKCVPDLQSTTISGDPDNPIPPLIVIGPHDPSAGPS